MLQAAGVVGAAMRALHVSSRPDVAETIDSSFSSGTTPDSPSEQINSRSLVETWISVTSTCGSSPPESARVTTLRQGWRRASASDSTPARTCSPTHE
jgi:hypothetical protein